MGKYFFDKILCWVTFQVTLCFNYFFRLPEEKVLDPKGSYIRMFQTKIRNICLSVISEYFLLSVVCNVTAAYTTLCGGLRGLLVYSSVAQFLIFKTLCLDRSKTLPYEHSQNVCLASKYILM